MVEPPKDTPFGLEPNLAAGLAYLFCIVGGLVMLLGGGTNRFVKWSAAQSITLWLTFFVLGIALGIVNTMLLAMHLWFLMAPLFFLIDIVAFVAWIYTTITGFQGKEVRLPFVAGLTEKFFASQLT